MASTETTPTPAAPTGRHQSGEPLTALDFVKGWLARTDLQPAQGHAVESHACREPRPSGLPKDSTYRCHRCDGEALLAAARTQQTS